MAKYQPCLQPIYREILVAIENPTNFLVNANIGSSSLSGIQKRWRNSCKIPVQCTVVALMLQKLRRLHWSAPKADHWHHTTVQDLNNCNINRTHIFTLTVDTARKMYFDNLWSLLHWWSRSCSKASVTWAPKSKKNSCINTLKYQ